MVTLAVLRADLLDAIDAVMRHVRGKSHLSFGGVQVLFIGDLFQLPPVTKKQEREINRAYNKAELRKKNQIRKAEGKKVKEKPINRVKKCDELRSKYIRNKYTECYTCGGKQS